MDAVIPFQQLPALLYVLYAVIDRARRITREKTKAKVQVANAIQFINGCTEMPQAAAISDQILGFKTISGLAKYQRVAKGKGLDMVSLGEATTWFT